MTLNLDAIKARADAATEGPLYSEANEHNDAFDLCNQPGRWDSSETKVYLECDPADATFITAAYTDIPALVAEVERLQNIVERVRESVHTVRHALHLTGDLDPREVLQHITTAMETE